MSNKVKLSYADNFRESMLLMTVFYVMLLPTHDVKATAIDITWLVIQFLVFGSFLFQTARLVAKDSMLFPWDKVIFIITLLMEGGLMAVRPFVKPLPISLSWIVLIWADAMIIIGMALLGVYPALDKKGKWRCALPAEEAGGMAFSSYLTISVSLLAIHHVIFYL